MITHLPIHESVYQTLIGDYDDNDDNKTTVKILKAHPHSKQIFCCRPLSAHKLSRRLPFLR